MIVRLLLPLCLVACACTQDVYQTVNVTQSRQCLGAPEQVRLRADIRFTREERDAIHSAARAWSEASCRKSVRVEFTLTDPENHEWYAAHGGHIVVKSEGVKVPFDAQAFEGWTLGTRLFIGPLKECSVQTVALHEMGHFFGMPHVEDGQAMSASCKGKRAEISPSDLATSKDEGICAP